MVKKNYRHDCVSHCVILLTTFTYTATALRGDQQNTWFLSLVLLIYVTYLVVVFENNVKYVIAILGLC